MSRRKPKLRLFLDEGVPLEVGQTFEANGHEVIYLQEAIKRGSTDTLVCSAAEANDAVLVAFDNDMKRLARRHGVGSGRFKKLSLIKISCPEPMGAQRLEEAMSLIEHEWHVSHGKSSRRMFVEISTHVIRSYR